MTEAYTGTGTNGALAVGGMETRPERLAPLRTIDPVAEAAREQAHVDWRVRSGTLAYGVFEGSGTVTAYRDGRNVDVDVVADKPVTLRSMVPHGDFKEGEPIDMVTPLARPT